MVNANQTSHLVSCDLCVGIPISHTVCQHLVSIVSECVFNVKVLVGDFNQEKALVGAFSIIVISSRTFV